MTEDKTGIIALKHQRKFIYSGAIHTGLVGGFGSGKSKAGTIKTVAKKLRYPNINVAYYLPTYGLIRDIAFPNFSEMLEEVGLPYTLNRQEFSFSTPYGKIILRSMTNPETIVGYEVGYSLIDEADIIHKKKMSEVFKKILGRNRIKLPDGLPNSTDLVSTPEGFKFLYDFFVKNKKPNRVLIKAKTADNPYLSESYIETLKETYSENELEAYLNGEFVNLTSGTVHHTFDREKNHSDREIKKGDVLHIGMDFNIGNMSAIVHVIDTAKDRNIKRYKIAVDEITKAYDTAEIIRLIKNKYPDHKIAVYPDASGSARKTSASKTDIQLLKEARFIIKTGKKNPSVRDRITTMNAAFLNAKGERSYLVNTFRCPEYAEALEQLPYKNDEPDKQSGFDHLCEAGGYFIFQTTHKKPIRIT